jgi:hypothetical protein
LEPGKANEDAELQERKERKKERIHIAPASLNVVK